MARGAGGQGNARVDAAARALGGLRALWLAHTTRDAATDTLHRVLRRFRGGREPVAAVGRAALYELDLALFNAT